MPITTTHLSYDQMVARWTRCRDCFDGEDAVKAKGREYLPPLDGQHDASPEYLAYKRRASFYPALERTVAGLAGLVLRREPTVAAPTAVEPQLADLTLSTESVVAVTTTAIVELLVVGRFGVMVDWRGAADSAVGRPYWTLYRSEDIVNWHELVVDGQRVLTHLVLREYFVRRSTTDPFISEVATRYREYVLADGGLEVRVWEQVENADRRGEWTVVGVTFPARRGKRLTFIPFVCAGPRGLTLVPEKPPLVDLVNVNLSHYRNSADYEHGLHYVALPTPYVIGYGLPPSTVIPQDLMPESGAGAVMAPASQPTKPALHIGAGTAWQIPNEKATVGMLEFSGAGLAAIVSALERKEKQMASLGARLLDTSHRYAETAEAVRTKQGATTSALQMLAESTSLLMTAALRYHVWWVTGVEEPAENVAVDVNKDFFDTKLSPQELSELTKLWQAGGISYETLYWNLAQGEVTRPNVDVEEEKRRIEEEEGENAEKAAEMGLPVGGEGEDDETPDDEDDDKSADSDDDE